MADTPTLVATPGSATANTYCTLAEAETYHAARVTHTAWAAATDDNKNKALLMATRVLDTRWDWRNWPTDEDQALQWPRSGMLAANGWSLIEDDEIPPELKNAQAELAAQLLTDDRTLDYDVERYGLRSLSAGPVSLAFKDDVKNKVIPDAVTQLLPPWWGTLRSYRPTCLQALRV